MQYQIMAAPVIVGILFYGIVGLFGVLLVGAMLTTETPQQRKRRERREMLDTLKGIEKALNK